jgi:hypothetical protein
MPHRAPPPARAPPHRGPSPEPLPGEPPPRRARPAQRPRAPVAAPRPRALVTCPRLRLGRMPWPRPDRAPGRAFACSCPSSCPGSPAPRARARFACPRHAQRALARAIVVARRSTLILIHFNFSLVNVLRCALRRATVHSKFVFINVLRRALRRTTILFKFIFIMVLRRATIHFK